MNIKVIDDFLSKEHQDALEDALLDGHFNWFFYRSTNNDYGIKKTEFVKEASQFCHTFFKGEVTSQYFHILQPLIWGMHYREGIDITRPLRIKANLTTKEQDFPEGFYRTPHVDCANVANYVTAVYYVNDADGDTLFFDDEMNIVKKVTPKKGRLALFDGNIYHAKEPSRDSEYRMVINLNFERQE